MNLLPDMKKAKLMSYAVTTSFLLIHVLMYIVFRRCRVYPMMYFNIFSMCFYLAMSFAIWKELLRFFAIGTYFEVLAHMALAVFFVGWDSGFQVTLIGMGILLFYSEYVGRTLRIRFVHALPVSMLGMLVYLVSLVISHYHAPAYRLPGHVEFAFQFLWGVIVFVITIFFLQIFVIMTSGSEALLSEEAMHDKLTGLPNRYYMSDYLKKVLDSKETGGYWVAMADLDGFKSINDTYGHNCGDYILKTLAILLKSMDADMELCRWGGEEFLMAGKLEDGMEGVYSRLDRVRRTIADYSFWYEEQRLNMTVTIGVAAYEPGQSMEEWINCADKRLYKGKCSGKNQVVA